MGSEYYISRHFSGNGFLFLHAGSNAGRSPIVKAKSLSRYTAAERWEGVDVMPALREMVLFSKSPPILSLHGLVGLHCRSGAESGDQWFVIDLLFPCPGRGVWRRGGGMCRIVPVGRRQLRSFLRPFRFLVRRDASGCLWSRSGRSFRVPGP